jgi:hypothetical protein
MEEITREDKERWDRVRENMDLLFEKMEQIEPNQRKMDTRFHTTGKVFEQVLQDQKTLANK